MPAISHCRVRAARWKSASVNPGLPGPAGNRNDGVEGGTVAFLQSALKVGPSGSTRPSGWIVDEHTSLERFNGGDGFGADDTIQGERLHGGTAMLVEKLLHDADIDKAIDTATADRSMDDDSHLSPLSLGDPMHTSTTAQDRGQRFDYS